MVENLIREFLIKDPTACELLVTAAGAADDPAGASCAPIKHHRVTVTNPLRKHHRALGFARYLVGLPATVRRLRRILLSGEINCVNIHYPSLAALTFALVQQFLPSRFDIVLSFHGADFDRPEAAVGVERFLWQKLFSSAKHLVVCSNALRRRIVDVYPGAAEKTITIHNGISEQEVLKAAQIGTPPPGLEEQEFVLNAATFEEKKGQDILVRAFAELTIDFPELRLVLMGRKGPALQSIRSLVENLNLQHRVSIHTDVPHPDLLATMRQARLFALPSRREPFGIVLLEAGIFRLPVVCSRTGGIPEIITDGRNGLLVDVDDVRGVSDAIRSILTGDARAAGLGTNLQQHVRSNYSWAEAAEQYLVALSE